MAEFSAGTVATAVSMAVDHVTSEVVGAFQRERINPVLLKGPSIARWLYPAGGRPYGDTDLLVSPGDFGGATSVLVTLGFGSPAHSPGDHAYTYRRAESGGFQLCVDLHRTLPYCAVPPAEVWRALSSGTERMSMGAVDVDVLGFPQRCLHIAMHALQHAFEARGPFEDLRRAVDTATMQQWSDAAAISRALGAEDAFAAGLCLIPEGRDLSARLGLTTARRGILRIAAAADTETEGGAYQVQRVLDASSARERLRLLVNPVLVSPTVLRQVSPLARRGRTGLALAYASRPFLLVRRMGPALATRRRILKEDEVGG
jgi:hypothetical protein